MKEADLDEVMGIEKLSFPNPWTRGMFENELENPASFAFVVRGLERAGVAAYIVFWVVEGEAHILNLAVNPECRQKGIAAKLLQAVLRRMEDNMVYAVFLEVRRSNKLAIRLYRNFGFKEIYDRKNYYGDEDAIVMTLLFDNGA
jgi:ribosomal-protein-alanine N-acetyltransferase